MVRGIREEVVWWGGGLGRSIRVVWWGVGGIREE